MSICLFLQRCTIDLLVIIIHIFLFILDIFAGQVFHDMTGKFIDSFGFKNVALVFLLTLLLLVIIIPLFLLNCRLFERSIILFGQNAVFHLFDIFS